MYNLIMKDILIQKKQLLFSLVYLTFILIGFQRMGEAMFAMGLVAFTYMLSMTSCAYEEKNKSDIMLNSLPIRRISIVTAKYLSVLSYFIMGTLVYVMMSGIINMLPIPFKVFPLTLEAFIGGFMAVCLMTGIYFPIYFKFGYMKMRIANFVLFFLFFFGSSLLAEYLQREHKNPLIQNIISFMDTQNDAVVALIIIAAALIFTVASFILSVWFYKNREF